MSLKFASRWFDSELRLRLTSIDPDEPIFNSDFCWVPKKEEITQWQRLLDAVNTRTSMRIETPHDNYQPFVEVIVDRYNATVTAFRYEISDNFYEDDFSEEITLNEIKQIAEEIISELKKLN
ncbi:Hypothetical protein PACV_10 [Pacmanvirus A23]|uniref:Hypothetical protein n=1 Tax=Pacmanvirus A23 TaxID=1932881 RepID=UPI000A095D38|nr:Hypothetical protein B9W72_gp010 [Pacmanvirus A23]SIP85727.1 Hypothetical protein PACV_10 [Pacmanvirus A23]